MKVIRPTSSTNGPNTGIFSKAAVARPAPEEIVPFAMAVESSGLASSVVMSMRPVSKQTTTVSQNVPVMETSAWRAGFFVVAEDATNGAEPMPDSLEKMPRLKPNCKARVTVEPTAPPAAPAGVKAPTII